MDYIYTTKPIEMAAQTAADNIIKHLSYGEKVLWLLTGGSGTAIAIAADKLLTGQDLSNLTVSLTDERYGEIGHKDENWQQLLDMGLQLEGATLYRPLIGQSREATVAAFGSWLQKQLAINNYRLGLFGFGSDGHTAGIKPGSPAIKTTDLASIYVGQDFERLTMTFPAILKLDEAIVQASGAEKTAILEDLLKNDKPLAEQPVQILKQLPKVTIFTNNQLEK